MLFLRSLVYNIILYTTLFVFSIKSKFLSEQKMSKCLISTSKFLNSWLKLICNLDYKIQNPNQKPKTPVIYAVKHESAWETFSLIDILAPNIFVLKKELTKIPLFGSALKKLQMIAVERNHSMKSMMNLIRDSKAVFENNKSLIIFPEGTRSKPKTLGKLSSGVYAIYNANKIPVQPVFINSGTFWPRKSFLKNPGTITVEFLDLIEPGMNKNDFMQKLEQSFKNKLESTNEKNN